MSVDRCIAEISAAVSDKMSDAELRDLNAHVQKIIKRVRAEQQGRAAEDAVMSAVQQFSEDLEITALKERRNAYLNKRAQLNAISTLWETWRDDLGEGYASFLGGGLTARKGAADSIASSQEALARDYVGSFLAELKKAEVYDYAVKGGDELNIRKAVYEYSKAEPDKVALQKLPKEARVAGKIIHKLNERVRRDANLAGAWIRPLEGYVTKRTHDEYKIARAAGKHIPVGDPRHFKQWVQDLESWGIDWSRSFPDVAVEDREKVLRSMYASLVTGKHLTYPGGPPTGFKGFGSIGKRMSHQRLLHFKDAAGEFHYDQKYGVGNLIEQIMFGVEHHARDIELMRRLGPNAEMNRDVIVDTIVARLRKEGDLEGERRFLGKVESINRVVWPHITGQTAVAVNRPFASWSRAVRNIEVMTDLGSAVLSAMSDPAFFATALRHNGGSFLDGLGRSVKSLFNAIPEADRVRVASEMGIIVDAVRSPIVSRFDAGGRPAGMTGAMVQKFFGLNLLRPWTDRLRLGFAMIQGHRLAKWSGKTFDELPESLRLTFTKYGITDAEWNALRSGRLSDAAGREFLTPDAAHSASDEAIDAYLAAIGRKPSKIARRQAREDLQAKMRTYYFSEGASAVLEPLPATRALMLQGTRPGTIAGEGVRHFNLYKSFMFSVLRQVMGRELHGYGVNRASTLHALAGLVRNPTGSPMRGIAQIMLVNTALGYLAMSLKDLAKGRTPRIPEDPQMALKITLAAMAQGGGAGIYGDFLFGQMRNRHGEGPVSTIMGPSARRVNQIAGLWTDLVNGDATAAKTFRTVINNTPFVNLFYTRWALDYLILWQIQEWLSPGAMRRMERTVRRENGQEFIIPPTEAVR